MTSFAESVVESATLAWLEATGWLIAHGPEIAPDMPAAERADYGEVVLAQRLRDALTRLNPEHPADAHAERITQAEPVPRPSCGPAIRRNPNCRMAEA